MNYNKQKKDLLNEHWIEDMQRSLEEMPEEVAKQIIESMTEQEIYIRVSKRQFQEDYIGDYIDFLWDISREAFWKHVAATFDVNKGLLWAGDMLYIEKICKNEIPKLALEKIIDFWINYKTQNPDNDMHLEGLACILKAQCLRFNKKEEILNIVKKKNKESLQSYGMMLDKFINQECKYYFYDN